MELNQPLPQSSLSCCHLMVLWPETLEPRHKVPQTSAACKELSRTQAAHVRGQTRGGLMWTRVVGIAEYLENRDPSPVVPGTPTPRLWPFERAKETRGRLKAWASSHPLSSNHLPHPHPCWPLSSLHSTRSPHPHAATDTMHSAHA